MHTSTWNRYIVVFVFSVVAIIASSAPSRAQDYQPEIDRLAEDIAVQVAKYRLKNIAVLDFTDLQGNTQEIGRFLAQELITSLVLKERTFKTIDRANLRNILQEQKLSMTGLQNSDEAKKLKISGVDGLIRGTVTRLNEGVRLTLQIITVENGTIVGGTRGTVPHTSDMESLGSNLELSSNSSLDGSSSNSSASRNGKGPVFQDQNIRVTLKFFRKDSGNKLKAMFLIDNLKGDDLEVKWKELQIFDEQGEQWLVGDNYGLSFYSPVTLTPKTPLTAVVVFHVQNGSGSKATQFNVVGSIITKTGNRDALSYLSFNNVRLGI